MAYQVTLDDLREIKIGQQEGLRFAVVVILQAKDDALHSLVVPGFRLYSGSISPPATRSKGKWYTMLYTDRGFAETLYRELEYELDVRDWLEKYPLNTFESATSELYSLAKMTMLAPCLVGKI